MHTETRTHAILFAALLSAGGCGSATPAAQEPAQPVGAAEADVEGEAALERYPEHDAERSDQYDPATETDAYNHRDSNDDEMMEHQCLEGDCPEGP